MDIPSPKTIAALVAMFANRRAGPHAHASGGEWWSKYVSWRSHGHGTGAEMPYGLFLRSSFFICVFTTLSGCAGYHVGNASLFPPDIHTVYVPMFESDSFRRDLGEQLTEAVCKEIEGRGPFKVVGTPNADSVLTGRITGDTKHALFREPNNEARAIEMGLIVRVSWADRRGNIVRDGQVPLPPEMIDMNQTSQIIPEYGSSTVSSQQQMIKRLAKQIVDLMEVPW